MKTEIPVCLGPVHTYLAQTIEIQYFSLNHRDF